MLKRVILLFSEPYHHPAFVFGILLPFPNRVTASTKSNAVIRIESRPLHISSPVVGTIEWEIFPLTPHAFPVSTPNKQGKLRVRIFQIPELYHENVSAGTLKTVSVNHTQSDTFGLNERLMSE